MKLKPIFLSLSLFSLLFASCSTSSMVTSSESLSSTSSPISSSSEESVDLGDEERPDKSNLPYVSSLDSLKKDDWKAYWIWEKKTVVDTHVCFRKTFSLSKVPDIAIAHIAVESKYTMWVNNQLVVVDGGIKRGPSYVDSYYQDVDLSSYLKAGENLITILVSYWGEGGNSSITTDEQGGLLFEMDLKEINIRSDSSFKVKRLGEYKNKRTLVSQGNYPDHSHNSFLAEPYVYFDANEAIGDYTLLSFDDSTWANASYIATPSYAPFGDTYLSDVPLFGFDKSLKDMEDIDNVLNKKFPSNSTVKFNLPYNMQFLPYFECESESDAARITFYTNTNYTDGIASFYDDYVTKIGSQSYQQLEWRSGYQFILEVPAGVTLKRVSYLETYYNATNQGSFESGDTYLDTLWEKSSNTMHICMRDTFMDCPERERSPYSGDGANQIEESLYSLGEDGWKLAKKTYSTLAGWVKDDNIIPTRWPSNKTNECPMQNLAFIATSRNYYLATGDEKTIKNIYPIFMNYVKLWNMNQDNTIEYRNGTFPWTDWGTDTDDIVMENAWYYWALSTLSTMGKELQITDDVSYLESRMSLLKQGFNSFKTDKGFTSKEDSYDDRANALAVLSGLASQDDYSNITNILTTSKNSSPYMERFVLQALCEMNQLELAKDRMLSRYKKMIDSPITTLWELWDSGDMSTGTINHGWSGGPLIIMSKYFAGFKPTSSGYKTYNLDLSGILSNGSYKVKTPSGTLSYTLVESQGQIEVNISAPDNLQGTITVSDQLGSVSSYTGDKLVSITSNSFKLTGGTAKITISK